MAKRILSSKNHQSQPHSSMTSSQQHQSATSSGSQPQSNWRTAMYQSRNNSRIAPIMSSSRSEANLHSLRGPSNQQTNNNPSLEHYGENSNHLTVLKTKVWYHSQRNVQEASVWNWKKNLSELWYLCSIKKAIHSSTHCFHQCCLRTK